VLSIFLLNLVFLTDVSAAAHGDELTAVDEETLKRAGLSTDGPALIEFFRQRTLSDVDRQNLEKLVHQLGSSSFAEREAASKKLGGRGTAALPFLRKALETGDAEVERRARDCIEEIENGPGPQLPMAAARLLAARKPAGAIPVLLAYVPFAEDDQVEEEILATLLALVPPKGPLDAALTSALGDAAPTRRGAAARVVGERGDETQRAAVRRLLTDPDPLVRFRAARGLLAARDRQAVPTLLDLLTEAPAPLAWQAEEVLFRLAADKAPALTLGDGKADARRQCRAAWTAWWQANADKTDLGRADDAERLLGLTLGIEYNTGRVWEAGKDGRSRWELTNLAGPMDAMVLPGGRVLLAESNNHLVSERDLRGNVLWQVKTDGDSPTGCQRLANGNTFVSTYTSAREYTREGKQVYVLKIPGSNAIRRSRNGHVIYATADEIVEMDSAGNRVRAVKIPHETMWVGVEDLPGDRFLLASSGAGRVIEVDKNGKVLWEARVPGACGVTRLPNGHTLVATRGKVLELDRAGHTVWERPSDGYVRRVHRR
jgi:HEAT repeat protein/outer membrane protein assembly factor BamB